MFIAVKHAEKPCSESPVSVYEIGRGFSKQVQGLISAILLIMVLAYVGCIQCVETRMKIGNVQTVVVFRHCKCSGHAM
jgi:hypothetical protein